MIRIGGRGRGEDLTGRDVSRATKQHPADFHRDGREFRRRRGRKGIAMRTIRRPNGRGEAAREQQPHHHTVFHYCVPGTQAIMPTPWTLPFPTETTPFLKYIGGSKNPVFGMTAVVLAADPTSIFTLPVPSAGVPPASAESLSVASPAP